MTATTSGPRRPGSFAGAVIFAGPRGSRCEFEGQPNPCRQSRIGTALHDPHGSRGGLPSDPRRASFAGTSEPNGRRVPKKYLGYRTLEADARSNSAAFFWQSGHTPKNSTKCV